MAGARAPNRASTDNRGFAGALCAFQSWRRALLAQSTKKPVSGTAQLSACLRCACCCCRAGGRSRGVRSPPSDHWDAPAVRGVNPRGGRTFRSQEIEARAPETGRWTGPNASNMRLCRVPYCSKIAQCRDKSVLASFLAAMVRMRPVAKIRHWPKAAASSSSKHRFSIQKARPPAEAAYLNSTITLCARLQSLHSKV